ncbi:hypothetical protein [Paraburkholderia youngii]|uniref:hypothetical protein n=1 Tax=Paraburkholderia youngii TaxID=2782701 RepID=UPI003D1D892E
MSREKTQSSTVDASEYDEFDSCNIAKRATAHCEPLFISPIRGSSHTAQKENATLTYIRFKRRLYGVTCGHVFDSQFGEEAALVNMLGVFGQGTNYQFSDESRPHFMGKLLSLRTFDLHAPDIAITQLPDIFQALHMDPKSKVAIDLDHWSEPEWSAIRVPVAIGFPTEHKHEAEGVVSAESVAAYAPLTSGLAHGVETFVMHWTDKSNSGVRLSGMSGAPVFCTLADNTVTIIGIVFEGSPSTTADWERKRSGEGDGFLSHEDIHIRAVSLSPNIFAGWLEMIGVDDVVAG